MMYNQIALIAVVVVMIIVMINMTRRKKTVHDLRDKLSQQKKILVEVHAWAAPQLGHELAQTRATLLNATLCDCRACAKNYISVVEKSQMRADELDMMMRSAEEAGDSMAVAAIRDYIDRSFRDVCGRDDYIEALRKYVLMRLR
jgi:hypothetical protein